MSNETCKMRTSIYVHVHAKTMVMMGVCLCVCVERGGGGGGGREAVSHVHSGQFHRLYVTTSSRRE